MNRFQNQLLAVVVLLVTACGPEPVEPPHLLWSTDVAALENPFPDARLVGQGYGARPGWYAPFLHPKARTTKVKKLLDQWASRSASELSGVGAFAPVLIRPSEPVDPASLAGSVVRLHRVAGAWELLEKDVPVEHSTAALADTGREPDADFPEFMLVRPTIPLPGGEDGLVVVLDSVKTKDGRALGRGRQFEKDAPSRALANDAAKALGVAPARVLLALPQHAPDARAVLTSLAAWVTAQPAPRVTVPATRGLIDDNGAMRPVGTFHPADGEWPLVRTWVEKRHDVPAYGNVGQVTIGTIAARDLRENGLWRADWVENPALAPEVPLNFVLTVPAGAKPAGGWPLILGAHGLGGRNIPQQGNDTAFCLELSELFAKHGFACLGIDATSHGTRGNPFDFFALDDIVKVRDTMREMAFDQLQLARVAGELDVDGDGTKDIGELSYFGNSMGAVMGSTFVSFAPQVKTAVLNVPGAGLSNILTSTAMRDRVGLLMVAQTDLAFTSLEYYSAFPIFRAVAQSYIDPGDPIMLAHPASATQAVMVQEGVGDQTVPNATTDDLAHVLETELAMAPISGAAPLRKRVLADPAKFLTPAELLQFNPHNVFWDIAPFRDQVMRFLTSKGTVVEVP